MKTTYQKLTATGVPCLYRHESGTYYARKKITGKIHLESLQTDNRKVAEIKLADWIKRKAGATAGDITLEGLFQKFVETKAANKKGTHKNYQWVLNHLKKSCPFLQTAVIKINPLDIQKYVASLQFKAGASNRFFEILGAVLDIGVIGGYLHENPLKKTGLKLRRKINRKPPTIPSIEQAEEIIEKLYSKGAEDGPLCSRDFLRFLFLAGIGEAELKSLKWADVDWVNERIQIQRMKTGSYFFVPFYHWLKPFMLDLWNRRGCPTRGDIFKIQSVKQGIWNTCKKLNMPKFSPKSFRKACIVRQIRNRLPVDVVAKYQGHRDKGVLIQRTYIQVISETDSDYEKKMLKRMELIEQGKEEPQEKIKASK